MATKAKINKTKSFGTAKETINQTKKTTHGMGESILKRCDWQRVKIQNLQTAYTINIKEQKKNNNNKTTQSKTKLKTQIAISPKR